MADAKISALPAASAAVGTQEIAVNESGTSKKVTITQIQTLIAALSETIIDAKGNLIVGTADDTATNLGVGSDGQFLVALSSEAAGMLWRALTASDMPSSIDATKIGAGAVDNTEFGYLNGVTSALQTQIDGKSSTAHKAEHVSGGSDAFASGDLLDATARTQILIDGISQGTRRKLNLQAQSGSGLTITATDDGAGDEQVTVLFNNTGSGGGSSAWPFARVFTVDPTNPTSSTNFNTLAAAVAVAAAGDIIMVGAGTISCEDVTVSTDIEIRGAGKYKTILVGASSAYLIRLAGGGKLSNLTLQNTTSGGADSSGVLITTSAAVLDNVRSLVSATATDTSGFHNQIANTRLIDCEAQVTGGTNKYGLKTSASAEVHNGKYDGPTADLYISSGTLTRHNPVLVNDLTGGSGTQQGSYLDNSGNRKPSVGLVNLVMNYPALFVESGIPPFWWTEETANVTLSDVDADGEAISGLDAYNSRVFKVATDGSGGGDYIYQSLVHADDDRIANGDTVSLQAFVWLVDAGTVTMELYDVGGAAVLDSVTTTTTGAFVELKLENVTVGTTTTRIRFKHSANSATFYIANPMMNQGQRMMDEWTPRPLITKYNFTANIWSKNPGVTTWVDQDLSSYCHPLTAVVILKCDIYTPGAARAGYIRPNGSSSSPIVALNSVSTSYGYNWSREYICDEDQGIEEKVEDTTSTVWEADLLGFKYWG